MPWWLCSVFQLVQTNEEDMETLAVAVRVGTKLKITHNHRELDTIADRALPLLECHVHRYITSDIKHLMHNACTSHIYIKAGVATVTSSVYRLAKL